MTKSVTGPESMYSASTSLMILSLFETLMHHLVVKKATYICRSKAANTVISIDGQFSIAMNVLCQVLPRNLTVLPEHGPRAGKALH